MVNVADTRERLPDFNRQEYEPIKQRALVNILERRLNAINSFLLNLQLSLPEGTFAALEHDHSVEDILDISTFYVSKALLAELKLNDLMDVAVTNTPGTYAVNFNGATYSLVEIPATGGVSAFLSLSDTPAAYTGQALRLVRVNAAATGLEFIDAATLGGWTVISSATLLASGARYLALLTSSQDFTLPAFSAGQVFVIRNSLDSAEDALVRVLVGGTRRIAGLPIGENLTCDPGETIALVARTSAILDLITPGAVGPYGNDGLSATDQVESEAAAEFWLADTMPFKVFSYTAGFVTTIQLYMDAGLTDHRYTKTFNYSGGLLASIVLSRISDSATWTKSLSYNIDDALELIETA